MDKKPIWMDVAERFEGLHEIEGKENEPMIVEFLRIASRGKEYDDEMPWCSAFLNYVFVRSGFLPPYSIVARDWLKWGRELEYPKRYCVVALKRSGLVGSWQGHVGIMLGIDYASKRVLVYGGNQDNKVGQDWYALEDVLGYRWPTNALAFDTIKRHALIRKTCEILKAVEEPTTSSKIDVHVSWTDRMWLKVCNASKLAWAGVRSAAYIGSGTLQLVGNPGMVMLGMGIEQVLYLPQRSRNEENDQEPDKGIVQLIRDLITTIHLLYQKLLKKEKQNG